MTCRSFIHSQLGAHAHAWVSVQSLWSVAHHELERSFLLSLLVLLLLLLL